jgi:hypothetical protein
LVIGGSPQVSPDEHANPSKSDLDGSYYESLFWFVKPYY